MKTSFPKNTLKTNIKLFTEHFAIDGHTHLLNNLIQNEYSTKQNLHCIIKVLKHDQISMTLFDLMIIYLHYLYQNEVLLWQNLDHISFLQSLLDTKYI